MIEATDYLEELAARPAARAPATLDEIWDAEWRRAGLDTISGLGRPLANAVDQLAGAIESAAGSDLATLAAERKVPLGSAVTVDQRIRLLGELADTLPEDKRKEVDPLRDARGRAAAEAQRIEREAADIYQAPYGLSGMAVHFAAGVARQAVDPGNLLAGIATGGLAGGVFRAPLVSMLGRQALAGGLAQAAVEPIVQSAREELGLEAGLLPALANIGTAAFAAGGLAGLLRAGAWGVRAGFRAGTGREIAILQPEVPTPAEKRTVDAPMGTLRELYAKVRNQIAPEDFEAAARLAERQQVLDAEIVAKAPVSARNRRLAEISEALEAGRPVDSPPAAIVPIGETRSLIRPSGGRLEVRPAIVELDQVTVSHDLEGRVNPAYPAELQPRDRSAPASRTWVAEKAAALEPELLGDAPTTGLGAPVVGPDGIVEAGNGRVLLLQQAYERHPERVAAYREFLERQGYDTAGVKRPVLVRVREGELAMPLRAALAAESNISATAGMSVRERAFADAKMVDENLLAAHRGGELSSAQNAPFVRAFADRVIPAEERPTFVDANDRLSLEGARRLEAALVARAWGEQDIVAVLYETPDPTSKAILGAMAETGPIVARVRAAVADGRVPAEADPVPALIEAFRLVERARATNQRVGDMVDQVDLERGAVPEEVKAAARLFFRDDNLRQAAGRDTVAERIRHAAERALDQQNAIGDLFGVPFSATNALRAGALAGTTLEDVPFGGAGGRDELVRLLDREAPAKVISQHPMLQEAEKNAAAIPETDTLPGYGTAEFKANRQFKFTREVVAADGQKSKVEEIVVGYEAAIARLTEGAKAFSTNGPVKNEREATIVLGPPASGKSSLAERLARERFAAIVDSDEAKKVIPEFNGGIGSPATHTESAVLGNGVYANIVEEGANFVYPRVGSKIKEIRATIDELVALGYKVNLVNLTVADDEAYRRMVRRFLATGRIISAPYLEWVDGKPRKNYYILKEEGKVHEAADFDGNGPIGTLRAVDGADTRLAAQIADIPAAEGPGRGVGGDQPRLDAGEPGAVAGEAAEGAPGGAVRQSRGAADQEPEPPLGETIKAAAVRVDGKLYIGRLHPDAIESAANATGKTFEEVYAKTPTSDLDGFVTSSGRYVDRVEGLAIAEKSKQLAEGAPPLRMLFAEHLAGNEGAELPPAAMAQAQKIADQALARQPLGDPVHAREFDRLLEELGGDFELRLEDDSIRSARALIEEARADQQAAFALEACIGEAAAEAAMGAAI